MASGAIFDMVRTLLPKVPGKRTKELLFNCTAYPCGSEAVVKKQISRLCSETDGTIDGCLAFARVEQSRDEEIAMQFEDEEDA